jgi:hypothetical protein
MSSTLTPHDAIARGDERVSAKGQALVLQGGAQVEFREDRRRRAERTAASSRDQLESLQVSTPAEIEHYASAVLQEAIVRGTLTDADVLRALESSRGSFPTIYTVRDRMHSNGANVTDLDAIMTGTYGM